MICGEVAVVGGCNSTAETECLGLCYLVKPFSWARLRVVSTGWDVTTLPAMCTREIRSGYVCVKLSVVIELTECRLGGKDRMRECTGGGLLSQAMYYQAQRGCSMSNKVKK